MPLLWTRTFAILHFETPDFSGGPDDDAWPWVTVSPDVTLLHMGVDEDGGLLVGEDCKAIVHAYFRAKLWCDGFGQSAEDHPFVAHDDPRGILIASESREVGGVSERSPASMLSENQASYDTWTSTLTEWGFWVRKAQSTEECLAEIEVVLTPADRENALRTREKYPNQYRSDKAWLELMTSFVDRALESRLRETRWSGRSE